jgi:hypothetical protein
VKYVITYSLGIVSYPDLYSTYFDTSSHLVAMCAMHLLNGEINSVLLDSGRLCGAVVRVLGYRSGGPGSIPSTTRKKVVGLEQGPLSLVSTTEELLDRKVAAPV